MIGEDLAMGKEGGPQIGVREWKLNVVRKMVVEECEFIAARRLGRGSQNRWFEEWWWCGRVRVIGPEKWESEDVIGPEK